MNIQIVISSATLIAIAGYLLVRFINGIDAHKKDVYDKLGQKQDKDTCKEFRDSGRNE